jgi:uncharacterized protein YkwD
MKPSMSKFAWTFTTTGAIAALLLTGCEIPELTLPPLPTLKDGSGQSPITLAPAQSTSTAEMEAQVREAINEIRQQQGLEPLTHNERLTQVARDYSQRMAEQNFFAHVGPEGDTLADRVGSAGIFYFVVGENLFMGTNLPQPVTIAVEGWMESPGHRDNILRQEYRETGIGVWQQGNTYYFTQLFMRSL